MIYNAQKVPSSFFKRITQSLSSRWGLYKVNRNDPLEALLVEAIKGDYNSPLYNAPNIEIQGRNIGQANTSRLVPSSSEINKGLKEPITRAKGNMIDAGLAESEANLYEQKGSFKNIFKHTELRSPLTLYTGNNDLEVLSSSYYGLTKDSEQKLLQRLNKVVKELKQLQDGYSTYGSLQEKTLKDKWLEIQSLRMGINSHSLEKTKIATKLLIDHLRIKTGAIDLDKVKELLEQGANPFLRIKDTPPNTNNSTSAPFTAACEVGAAEAFQIMQKYAVDKGVHLSKSAVQILNNTMLYPKPFTFGHSEITSILNNLQFGLESSSTVLYNSCKNSPEPVPSFVNRCIAFGANPLASADNSWINVIPTSPQENKLADSALGWACQNGYLDVFKTIIETTALSPSEIICLEELVKDKISSLPEGHKKLDEYKQLASILGGTIKEAIKSPELTERMHFSQTKNAESTLYISPETSRLPPNKQNLYNISDEANLLGMC